MVTTAGVLDPADPGARPKDSLNDVDCAVSETETLRAVLMGTKSCPKILNFSTRFSCENLDVEDFVTLLMGKKSC